MRPTGAELVAADDDAGAAVRRKPAVSSAMAARATTAAANGGAATATASHSVAISIVPCTHQRSGTVRRSDTALGKPVTPIARIGG